jgi:hypothetical protein
MSVTEAIRRMAITSGHIVARPDQLHRVPRWLRERNAGPLELRTPWWPYAMVEYMDGALPRPSRVLEFGGGGSSLWLVDRGAELTVVEHHPDWIGQLRRSLPDSVELLAIAKNPTGTIGSGAESGYFDDYVAAVDRYPDETFDLVIVDGRARVDCARRAMAKVKPGGMLLLDDSDRPRYRPAAHALAGWPVTSFRGLKAGENVPATTSVWRRPIDGGRR